MSLSSTINNTVRQAVKKAAMDITKDLDLPRIKSRLEDLPGEIRNQKNIVQNCRQVLNDLAVQKEQEEALLYSMISSEIGENGKTKYSNKEARDAELIQRKQTSPTYQKIEQSCKEAESRLNKEQFVLESLQDEFRSLRIVAKITCKELSLLGLENDEEDDVDVY